MTKKLFTNFLFLLCIALACLILIGITHPSFAQITPSAAPGDGGNPCPGGEPCDPEVPIAGLEWLILAGGLFGFRKIYHKFKRN